MPTTLKDVAVEAGVSAKTVSNVVNGNFRRVSPQTAERVRAALAKLQYRPNVAARHLRNGQANVIALAVPDLRNPYFASLSAAIIAAAAERGYTVLIDHTGGEWDQESLALKGLRPHVIDGIILSPLALGMEDLQACDRDAPIALLGERLYEAPYDHVAIDNVAAARAATAHLLALGRQRIAFIGGPHDPQDDVCRLRLRGYQEALRAAHCPVDPALILPIRLHGNVPMRQDGREAMEHLLAVTPPPDAVVCFNDLLALGALKALHHARCRVPEDVALIGFDDIEEGSFATPSLSSIAPDTSEIGRAAVSMLLDRIQGTYTGPARLVQPSFRLVARDSTQSCDVVPGHAATGSIAAHRASEERRNQPFIWAAGIEDTFVPQATPRFRALDEYQLMGHYEHWREDLALLPDLGVTMVRWGVPWYRVEPRPGVFDWGWTDQVLPYLVEDLGLTILLDLVHYGCPLWLERAFADPTYPEAVARYAAAFARRYAGLVSWYTPNNEPLVAAAQCGHRGVWPPYLRGDNGRVRVLLQIVEGIRHTVAAIKEVDPQAVMVHVEAAGWTQTAEPDLAPLAAEATLHRYLSYDLLAGLVTPDHELFPWLVRHGAVPAQLRDIARDPISLDVVGLNFYPQWSAQELCLDRRGQMASRPRPDDGTGLAAMVAEYHQRYAASLMITETSARGSNRARADWLTASVNAVDQLRRRGVPVIGYTWFPLFTMIDWRYRQGHGPLAEYLLELGLYQLGEPDSEPRWQPTPLAAQFRAYAEHFIMAGEPSREEKVESETGA